MTHLTRETVDKLRVYSPWHAAPIGTVLQLRTPRSMNPPQELIVGLRCRLSNASPALLVLAKGEQFAIGKLLFGGGIDQAKGAIDISGHFDLGVNDPTVDDPHFPLPSTGFVYLCGDEIIVQAETSDSVVYVPLKRPNKGLVASGLIVEARLGFLTLIPKLGLRYSKRSPRSDSRDARMPRDGSITFGDLIGQLEHLEIACPKCDRAAKDSSWNAADLWRAQSERGVRDVCPWVQSDAPVFRRSLRLRVPASFFAFRDRIIRVPAIDCFGSEPERPKNGGPGLLLIVQNFADIRSVDFVFSGPRSLSAGLLDLTFE